MWPKEHGAYAELAFPLVTALACGRPTLASAMLVLASVAAFVAHEPAAVLFGVRGTRARREDGRRARAWLGLGALVAIPSGLAGLALAPRAVPFAIAALALAGAAALLLYGRKERTRAGEIIAGAALAGAAAPVGAASGLSTWLVFACWGAWVAQSAVSTVAVHALVAKRGTWPTLLATALVLGGASVVGWPVALAVAPTCLVCAAIALARLSVKSIRGIGYALAVAMVASAASLTASARLL